MSKTIQILQIPEPLITLNEISEESQEEPGSPHNDDNMLGRLRALLKQDWAIPEIRLIAWSEEKGSWYMWTKV
jgi:hypothetical protein